MANAKEIVRSPVGGVSLQIRTNDGGQVKIGMFIRNLRERAAADLTPHEARTLAQELRSFATQVEHGQQAGR